MHAHYPNKARGFSTGAKFLAWTILGFILAGTQFSRAQVANYAFSSGNGTYTELTDADIVAEPTALTGTGAVDDQKYPDIALPFEFPFNGNAYGQLTVHANGFISFGTSPSGNSPISNTDAFDGAIAAIAGDLHALYNIDGYSGNITTKTEGASPNQEFVIQWKNFRPYLNSTSVTSYFRWNFQIRLKEDGTINIVYDLNVTGTPTSMSAQIGLRGNSASDFSNRTAAGTALSNWTSTTAGTSNYATVTCNSATLPASGKVFTWNVPQPCSVPTTQPTALAFTLDGIIVTGNFLAANPSADKYLVLRTPEGTTPNPPSDGTVYATGNNTDLNARVSYIGPGLTFTDNSFSGIAGNTAYTYTVYALNSICEGGPSYNTENPLTGNVTTCPAPINAIVSANLTTTSFDLSWTPNNGDAAAYNYSVEVSKNADFAIQVAGSPFTVASDETAFSVTALEDSMKYYYRIKAVGTCSSVYSSVGNITTLCEAVAAVNENFDAVATPDLPACWSAIVRNLSTTYASVTTSANGNSTPNAISLYNSSANTDLEGSDIILVSPNLDNINSGLFRLKFKAKKSSSSDAAVQIGTLDNNTADAVFTPIGEEIELTTAYQEFTVYFTETGGSDNFIGFKRKGASTYTYLYIDDVVWEAIPACTEPSALTASEITPTTAAISWTAPASVPANGYEYFISTVNAAPAASDALIATNALTADLSGLASGTAYYVWLRSACGAASKSEWIVKPFSTITVTPSPWLEAFTTTTAPAAWNVSGWNIGSARGATGLNGATNIYKNLYGSALTAAFTTINVGPVAADDALTFDYKQTAYASPYAPLADWGNFEVQVSTDFGITWNTIAMVDNEAGTGEYLHKSYSLADYAGEYVSVKIIGNRTAGDFDLSFDNLAVNTEVIITNPVTGIEVTTLNSADAAITVSGGTLQLLAPVSPANANQNVHWSVVTGGAFAWVDQTGLVTAIQNGTIVVKAVSSEDGSIFATLEITISNQPLVFCTPSFPTGTEPITFVDFAGISNTSAAATSSVSYENFTAQTGYVAPGQNYTITLKGNTNGNYTTYFKVYADWNNNGAFEDSEGTSAGSVVNSNGTDAIQATATIAVPADAFTGNVRMRVLKKYNTATIDACNSAGYGQAEDYTLNVSEENLSIGDIEKTGFRLSPNPTADFVTVQATSEIDSITVYSQSGQKIGASKTKTGKVDLSGFAQGIYLLQIHFANGQQATQKVIRK